MCVSPGAGPASLNQRGAPQAGASRVTHSPVASSSPPSVITVFPPSRCPGLQRPKGPPEQGSLPSGSGFWQARAEPGCDPGQQTPRGGSWIRVILRSSGGEDVAAAHTRWWRPLGRCGPTVSKGAVVVGRDEVQKGQLSDYVAAVVSARDGSLMVYRIKGGGTDGLGLLGRPRQVHRSPVLPRPAVTADAPVAASPGIPSPQQQGDGGERGGQGPGRLAPQVPWDTMCRLSSSSSKGEARGPNSGRRTGTFAWQN